MRQLLDLFEHSPSNNHYEEYLRLESELHDDVRSGCNAPNRCYGTAKKMDEELCKWVNSVLPPSIDIYEWQVIYVWGIEYHFTQKQIVELAVKIIDGKNKHVDADSYYADAVKLISEASDDN